MTASDDLLRRNADCAHPARDPLLGGQPSLQVAIVTCMDCRIDLYDALGVKPGEAHTLRNAGGVVTDDVIRSLAVSQRKLGTREIMIMHHTRCGMTTFTDDEFKDELERDAGTRPAWSVGTFSDAQQDVRESVRRLSSDPYLISTAVRGFIHDVDTDELTEVS